MLSSAWINTVLHKSSFTFTPVYIHPEKVLLYFRYIKKKKWPVKKYGLKWGTTIHSILFKLQIQKLPVHCRPVKLAFIMCYQKDCVYPHPNGKSSPWVSDMERWGSQTSEKGWAYGWMIWRDEGAKPVRKASSPVKNMVYPFVKKPIQIFYKLVLMDFPELYRVCKYNAHDCSFSLKMI